jgi:zinc protease
MQIGVMETVGLDWRLLEEYPQRIAAVTPEQVMAVAREFFHDDNLTIAVLEPQPLDGTAPRAPAGGNTRH